MDINKKIAKYLRIKPDQLTELDKDYYANYYKVYTSDPPSKHHKCQLYAEFRISAIGSNKKMITDGYSWTRVHYGESEIQKSLDEASDFAKSKYIKKTGLQGSKTVKCYPTGVYAYVYILPKKTFYTPGGEPTP